MIQYRLSEEQRRQVQIYFFEYICSQIEKDPELSKDRTTKYEAIKMLAEQEMPRWINALEIQIGKDIEHGHVDREFAKKMDLGKILQNSVDELNHKSRE